VRTGYAENKLCFPDDTKPTAQCVEGVYSVGRCRLTVSNPVLKLESAYGFLVLKLESHKLLSTFAFNLNLRRHNSVPPCDVAYKNHMAGRCWLTL